MARAYMTKQHHLQAESVITASIKESVRRGKKTVALFRQFGEVLPQALCSVHILVGM